MWDSNLIQNVRKSEREFDETCSASIVSKQLLSSSVDNLSNDFTCCWPLFAFTWLWFRWIWNGFIPCIRNTSIISSSFSPSNATLDIETEKKQSNESNQWQIVKLRYIKTITRYSVVTKFSCISCDTSE